MSENITTISNNIWSLANVLRDDGVGNTKYLQQITYLLFLKMVDEYSKPPYNRDLKLPEGCSWSDLVDKDGAELNDKYELILKTLAAQPGILGQMYARSHNEISKPANLKKVINMIDKQNWSMLGQDVKG
ncbi:MAG: type I restriction-modification system subunit M N-terminal domain-containing protein, partial [Acholeplasma sp.]|nr:type I restriction-modification system subunit M N-terminal domain-containing protein [Acholeplasma sp.]